MPPKCYSILCDTQTSGEEMPKISFVLPCFLFQHQKARQNLVVFAAFDETKKISDDKVVFCQTDTLL